MSKRPPAGTPALQLLSRLGVAFSTHEYPHRPGERHFGLEAASALGLPPDQVFKTLVAEVDGALTVAVVPVSGSLDLKSLAAAAGGSRADLAATALAERSTGYVAGGISPIGQRRALPTFIDESAVLFDRIYVSGGRRGLDIGIAPDDLLAVTQGRYAPIARP